MFNKKLESLTKNQVQKIILDTAKNQNPETVKDLVMLVEKKSSLAPEEILKQIVVLEDENKLCFTQKPQPPPVNHRTYIFSMSAAWYWSTMIIAVVTLAMVFLVPNEAYPAIYLRSILGALFTLFLPGYVLLRTLYPSNVPIQTSNGTLDAVERLVLSLGVNLALVPMVGLILNFTPYGLNSTLITGCLFALIAIFATVALFREHQQKATQKQSIAA